MKKALFCTLSILILIAASKLVPTYSNDSSIPAARELVTNLHEDVPFNEPQNEDVEHIDNEHQIESVALKAEDLLSTARIIRKCREIPRTDEALNNWLNAVDKNEVSNFRVESVLSRFEQCKSVPAGKDYISKFIVAAKMGEVGAGPELWNITEIEYMKQMGFSELERGEYIERKNDFIKLKYQLVGELAASGHEKSIHILVDAYQRYDPDTGGQTYAKSLAFADFLLAITANNDSYRRVDWIKQRLIKKMTQEEIEEAQVMTTHFFEELESKRVSAQ